MDATRYCSWCRDPLPALPEDASFVDDINHTIHDRCRDERDAFAEAREVLLTAVAAGTSTPVPPEIKHAYLDGLRDAGLTRRCPCLYDAAYGFPGYDSHSWADDGRDYDERNAVADCRLCDGTGRYDELPVLLAMTDDAAAARWIQDKILRGSGPLRGHDGWHYSTLERHSDGRPIAGVVLYNVASTSGGIVAWPEIADVFRPRLQQTFF